MSTQTPLTREELLMLAELAWAHADAFDYDEKVWHEYNELFEKCTRLADQTLKEGAKQ